MNKSKFVNLTFNPIMKMNEIKRYASVYQQVEENLAEHTTEIMMLSYMISQILTRVYSEKIDTGVLLTKCLFHDVDEVVTGDIPRNTKYGNSTVLLGCRELASDSIKLIEDSLPCDITLRDFWKSAKEGKEGLILSICDMLVVVKKAITEVELHNNLSFLKVVEELENHLTKMIDNLEVPSEFSDDSVEYLKSLVTEAKNEIVTIRVKYQHVIDKYLIKENIIEGE